MSCKALTPTTVRARSRRHNAPREDLGSPPAGGRGSSPGATLQAVPARYRPSTVHPVRTRQLLLDAAIACGVFAFSLALLAHGGFDRTDRDLDLLGGVLAALSSLPLAARRLAPLRVFALVTA